MTQKPLPAIRLSEPRPLLDEGVYVARCIEATFAWARQWKKWMARLVLEPQNYTGRPYTGQLCKFLSLGGDPHSPFAGPQSAFRDLWVEANGAQPNGHEVNVQIFLGLVFEIRVETVKRDRHGKEKRPEHWYSIVREIHLLGDRTIQPLNTKPPNHSTVTTQTTLSTEQHSNTENIPLADWERISAHSTKPC